MLAIKTSLKDHHNIKIVSRNLKSGHVNCSRFKDCFHIFTCKSCKKFKEKKIHIKKINANGISLLSNSEKTCHLRTFSIDTNHSFVAL